MNLLLVDSTVFEVGLFTRSCNENTKFVIYDSHIDTFETVRQKIANLNIDKFDNLAFAFIDTHNFLNFFVSNNTFISFNSEGIQSNPTTEFIKELVTKYNISTIDFLACNLLRYPQWKQYFDYLANENKIKIRASNDRTGNLNSGGDWVLETTNENVKKIYFTDMINNWHYVLDFGFHCGIITTEPTNNLYLAGDNYWGQLGNGENMSVINKNKFINIDRNNVKLFEDKKILKVACGQKYTAIITNEETNNLYITGNNYNGQLGIGENNNKNINRFTNKNINGKELFPNKKVICISCSYHTAVLTNESTNNLYLAGNNFEGELGIGDVNNINKFRNKDISGNELFIDKQVISVSCGSFYTAVLTSEPTNNLYVTGLNRDGQLGTGNNDNIKKFTNKDILGTELFPNKKVINVSCCTNHTAVITDESANNLYITGKNNEGQLGIGNDVYQNKFTNKDSDGVELFVDKKIINVSCGESHTVVLTNEPINNLYVTGSNDDGQICIGYNMSINKFTNKDLDNNDLFENKNVINICCSKFSYGYVAYSSTFVLTNEPVNNLYVTGDNFSGRLGRCNNENISKFTNINANGVPLCANKKIKCISIGESHSAIISNEHANNLYLTGFNSDGQLGTGSDELTVKVNIFKNKDIHDNELFENKEVIGVSCGNDHTAVITNEPTNNLYVTGCNNNGQLGIGLNDGKKNRFRNKDISGAEIFENKKVIAVSCGDSHTLALTNELTNNLYITGNNGFGQLGIGSNENITKFTNKDILNMELFPNKQISDIFGGTGYSAVLTTENTNNLYLTGYNFSGLLGLGNNKNVNKFTNMDFKNADIMPNKKIIGVSCGGGHIAIRTDDEENNLYVCGSNYFGQLGIGNNKNINRFTNQDIKSMKLFPNKKVIGFSCGDNFTIVRTKESKNNLYVTGYNELGQLGIGNNKNINKFTNKNSKNKNLFDGKQIIGNYCGLGFTMVRTNEKTNNLYVTGTNYSGQLGTGNYISPKKFTQNKLFNKQVKKLNGKAI